MAGLCLCLILALILINNGSQVLTLRGPNGSKQLLYYQVVEPGDKVQLKFLHSYEKGWVEENYRVDGENFIYPVSHRFQVFNYDVREATYPGDFRMGDDGYASVTNIDKYVKVPINEWTIRVAYTVPQMIIVNGAEVSLRDLLPSGDSLMLSIERWPWFRLGLKKFSR